MSTTQETDVATRFLDALSRRDFDALASTFAEAAVFRGLVPSRLREEHGSEAVAGRFRFWFGDAEGYELVESGVEELADIVRIHWRVASVDPETGRCLTEQTAYAHIEDDRLAWMNLVCSGERPIQA